MKKLFHCSVALLLVISLFCAFSVTPMALSDKQVSESRNGTSTVGNLTYIYGATTTASTTFASASASCNRNIRLTATIVATLSIKGDNVDENVATDIIMGTSAYASVTNVKDRTSYDISKATGRFTIGSLADYTIVIT